MDLAEIKEWWDTFGPQNHFNPRVAERFTWLLTETARLTTDNAALTAENTRIFAMVDAREQTIAELTALCDEYRGEVEKAKGEAVGARLEGYRQRDRAEFYASGAACKDGCERIQSAKTEIVRLQSALTRARAEGMEEAERIARMDSMLDWRGGSTGSAVGTATNIAAAIRSAAKGER